MLWLGVSLQEVARTAEVCQAGGGSTANHPAFLTAPMHANATLTGFPKNFATGKDYRGINVFLLGSLVMAGYAAFVLGIAV